MCVTFSVVCTVIICVHYMKVHCIYLMETMILLNKIVAKNANIFEIVLFGKFYFVKYLIIY